MALQKAFNVSLRGLTVDSNDDNPVTWQVSGDIQTAYQVDFYLNSDNSLAFSSTKITSYSLKYTLPHGSLTNGNEYKIKITIFNSSGQSITNDGDIFQTSSRPVATVDPIGTVGSFNYNFTGEYTQAESVSLRSYVANLYDTNKNLLKTSGILTTTPIQYLFDELQTGTNYYIEFQVTSAKGLTGTSGLVSFSVSYYSPKQNVQLTGKNIDNAGIELTWYVRQIIFENSGGVFVNNDEIDVRSGTVTGDTGFSIDQDFSAKVWFRDLANNVPLLSFYGDNGQITLKYNAVMERFVVEKTTSFSTEKYMTPPIKIKNTTTDEYVYLTPYQPVLSLQGTIGDELTVLIQQIGMGINVSVTSSSSDAYTFELDGRFLLDGSILLGG